MQNNTEQVPAKHPGGRPKGSVSKRTLALRKVTNEAALKGVAPIEVMLENMRFFHQKADVLQTAVVTKLEKKSLKSEEAMELLMEFKELGVNRMKAQACAVDAAPYVHPRLSATQHTGEITHKHEEAEKAFKVIENALEAQVNGEIIPARERAKEQVG